MPGPGSSRFGTFTFGTTRLASAGSPAPPARTAFLARVSAAGYRGVARRDPRFLARVAPAGYASTIAKT